MSLDKQSIKNIILRFIERKTRIDELHRERSIRHERAAQRLLAEDMDGAEADMKWVRLSSEWLGVGQKKRCLYFIGCVIIIFIALCHLHYDTDIAFEVETEFVSLKLKEEWNIPTGIVSNQIYTDCMVMLNAPALDNLHHTYSDEASETMELTNGEIFVRKLRIEKLKDTETEIELNVKRIGNVIKLLIKNGRLSGELSVRHAELYLERKAQEIPIAFEDSQTIEFTSAQAIGIPIQFEFISESEWLLSEIQANKISFSEEKPNQPDFISKIYSGKITVRETKKTQDLQEADNLILKGMKCKRLNISKGDKGIVVSFEGVASEILAGHKGFEDNLTLTWLEYIWNRKALGIFLLALLSFLGKNFYLGD